MNTGKDLWIKYYPAFERVSLSPESDFRWLMEKVTGQTYSLNTIDSEKPLDNDQLELACEFLDRRSMGEPVAYILGEWDFYGRTFNVGPGVLVPRSETELIIDLYKRFFSADQRLKIADLGSGSGCLAITLALESPQSHITAVEISEQAFAPRLLLRGLHFLQEAVSPTAPNDDVPRQHIVNLIEQSLTIL